MAMPTSCGASDGGGTVHLIEGNTVANLNLPQQLGTSWQVNDTDDFNQTASPTSSGGTADGTTKILMP
jgi:hypothetical protein